MRPNARLLSTALVAALSGCGGSSAGSEAPAACYDGAAVTGDATTFGAPLTASSCYAEPIAMAAMSGVGQASARLDALGGAAACGTCLEIAGPGGTRVARVVEDCRGCLPGTLLDLDADTFAGVGGGTAGIAAVSVRAVPCPVEGNLRYASASATSPYYVQLWVTNARHAIAGVELRVGGAWQAMARANDAGFVWTTAGATAEAPYTLRVSDVFGHSVEDTVGVAAGEAVSGSVQLPTCG